MFPQSACPQEVFTSMLGCAEGSALCCSACSASQYELVASPQRPCLTGDVHTEAFQFSAFLAGCILEFLRSCARTRMWLAHRTAQIEPCLRMVSLVLCNPCLKADCISYLEAQDGAGPVSSLE